MSVEDGTVSQLQFDTLALYEDYAIFQIIDTIPMVAGGAVLTTDEHVSGVVMPKIINVVNMALMTSMPLAFALLPHQDPRSYGIQDDTADATMNASSQVWREALMYLQRFIYLMSSMSLEAVTIRAAMAPPGGWFPTTSADAATWAA